MADSGPGTNGDGEEEDLLESPIKVPSDLQTKKRNEGPDKETFRTSNI